ncbi:MAG: F-actin-capping protein subunit alpha [Sclerophora amabilis]|nr:MAG: F-actin-capping protein subunit alpha [Sclerophora amabilis]
MPSTKLATLSSFVGGAPPGELEDVVADIKALTTDEPNLLSSLNSALEKYNEEQLCTVELPGGNQQAIISSHSAVGNRYYDVASQRSFVVDHATQKASAVESFVPQTNNIDLLKSLLKSLAAHATEHFPSATVGAYPIENDSAIAILLVANKYSPTNYWNGRWRSEYILSPSDATLTGSIKVDVHYYEDGNVRLLTNKTVSISLSSSPSAVEITKHISAAEKKYQEELNRAFNNLSEETFKGLRRQLPVSRQKIKWENIGSYRLGQDVGGGRNR